MQGYDLTMKPDISAPGSLYSSLPNSTYQTWPGTSMSAPYMAGDWVIGGLVLS
jgi:subtilisin family serine protease